MGTYTGDEVKATAYGDSQHPIHTGGGAPRRGGQGRGKNLPSPTQQLLSSMDDSTNIPITFPATITLSLLPSSTRFFCFLV